MNQPTDLCPRRLWPGGYYCYLPAKHEGACMYAKPGSALNPTDTNPTNGAAISSINGKRI